MYIIKAGGVVSDGSDEELCGHCGTAMVWKKVSGLNRKW